MGDFQRREFPVEDPEFVNLPVGESAVPEALTDRDVVAAAAGDVLIEIISNGLLGGQLAIQVYFQTCCSA